MYYSASREALIEPQFASGGPDHIRSQYPEAESRGIIFTPSALGAELFLWAHARGTSLMHNILNPHIDLTCSIRINTAPGCHSIQFPERTYP